MDAFFPTLVACFLAEWGDKTQLLAMALGIRLDRTGSILTGIALAAILNAALAAFGGYLLAPLIAFRPITLLLALSLLLAGGGGLWKQKQRDPVLYPKLGTFLASAFAFFVMEFGDKSQLITLAFAARTQSPALAAAGSAIGVVLAAFPAVLMREQFQKRLPIRAIQMGASAILLLCGLLAAISALELV